MFLELDIILKIFLTFLGGQAEKTPRKTLSQLLQGGGQSGSEKWTQLTKYFFCDTGLDGVTYFCPVTDLNTKRHDLV